MELTLNIVNKKRRLSFRIFLSIFLFSIVALIPLVIFLENRIIIISLTAIGFISGALVTSLKEHIVDGHIILNENQILVVNSTNKKKMHYIKSLDNIKILYCEYAGGHYPFNPKSIGFTKGLNNHIILKKEGSFETYEVLLKKSDLTRINQLVNDWRKKSVEVILTNKWGKNVKQL